MGGVYFVRGDKDQLFKNKTTWFYINNIILFNIEYIKSLVDKYKKRYIKNNNLEECDKLIKKIIEFLCQKYNITLKNSKLSLIL